MAVDLSIAAGLKAEAYFVRLAAAGDLPSAHPEVRRVSPLALRADAIPEAERAAAFLGGPLVRDRVTVRGARRDLVGTGRTIRASKLGYQNGVPCFVIAAEEDVATTTLTVLRKL